MIPEPYLDMLIVFIGCLFIIGLLYFVDYLFEGRSPKR